MATKTGQLSGGMFASFMPSGGAMGGSAISNPRRPSMVNTASSIPVVRDDTSSREGPFVHWCLCGCLPVDAVVVARVRWLRCLAYGDDGGGGGGRSTDPEKAVSVEDEASGKRLVNRIKFRNALQLLFQVLMKRPAWTTEEISETVQVVVDVCAVDGSRLITSLIEYADGQWWVGPWLFGFGFGWTGTSGLVC